MRIPTLLSTIVLLVVLIPASATADERPQTPTSPSVDGAATASDPTTGSDWSPASDDETPDWNLTGEGSGEVTAMAAWGCAGDAVEPDEWYDMPGYIRSVAYTATQTCWGAYGLQRSCARLQKWNYGTYAWNNVTAFRCGSWTTSTYSIGSGVVRCSDVGPGKYRTRGRGEADTPQGFFTAYGNSNGVILCQ